MTNSTPLKFIQNSDYTSLANDSDSVTVSVTVPNGGSSVVTADVSVGTTGAPIFYTIKDSVSGFEWACQEFTYVDGAGTSVVVNVSRSSATSARITATPSGAISGSVTFTARIRSFVPPIT